MSNLRTTSPVKDYKENRKEETPMDKTLALTLLYSDIELTPEELQQAINTLQKEGE